MCSTTQFCFLNLRTYLIYLCCYLLIMVAAGSRVVNGLKCYCNPKECDVIRSLDCPGKGLMLWDPCKCCRICAKTLGETCGGPGGFSGQCEPPLQCVTKLPITSGLGVCMDLPFASSTTTFAASSSSSTYHSSSSGGSGTDRNCSSSRGSSAATQMVTIAPGCEITNKRCQCWPTLRVCRSIEDETQAADVAHNGVALSDANDVAQTAIDTRWHFKTLEDCQLNLQNLIKIEMEFDEDYTVSPSTFTYKKLRRKRRSLRKRTLIITH